LRQKITPQGQTFLVLLSCPHNARFIRRYTHTHSTNIRWLNYLFWWELTKQSYLWHCFLTNFHG